MVATKKQKIDYIAGLVADCKKCSLYKTALHHVPGFGNSEAKIVFIGEAPGAKEDELGLPFVGNSGKLLDKLLASISVNRSDVFICNILKHRPPQNRDPLPEEIRVCVPFLKAQLKVIEPQIVVTLGRFAMNFFFPEDSITSMHGQIKKITWQGLPLVVIPVYHPSAGLRNGKMLSALEKDFQTIGKFLNTIK